MGLNFSGNESVKHPTNKILFLRTDKEQISKTNEEQSRIHLLFLFVNVFPHHPSPTCR
jgi:hypothetical protein